MSLENRRPKWVWVIFLWFVFGGLTSTYKFYTLLAGTMVLPAGVEQPTGAFYYFQAFGFNILAMVAASMLFFRRAANRWFFLAMLVISIPSILYSVLSSTIPENYLVSTLAIMAVTLGLYALIARYTFKLVNTNYYSGSSHNKQSKADA